MAVVIWASAGPDALAGCDCSRFEPPLHTGLPVAWCFIPSRSASWNTICIVLISNFVRVVSAQLDFERSYVWRDMAVSVLRRGRTLSAFSGTSQTISEPIVHEDRSKSDGAHLIERM
jgi:hypothetical protein